MFKSKAFTLIELLIVVAIIAILAAIAVPNFLEAQTRSKVSRTKADMRTVATALEAYAVDYNQHPPSWAAQDGSAQSGGSDTEFGFAAAPVNPRIQRLAYLTTPVAFITSVLNDPFAVGTQDSFALNQEYPVFTYWDRGFIGARTLNAAAATHFEDVPQILSNPSWGLIGYGPDQIFHPAAFFPQLRLYDPTNGTLSEGDVMRFGTGGSAE